MLDENEELTEFFEKQKILLNEDKRKLDLRFTGNPDKDDCDTRDTDEENQSSRNGVGLSNGNSNIPVETDEVNVGNKEYCDCNNVSSGTQDDFCRENKLKSCSVEPIDLSFWRDNEKKKRDYVDQVANSESPFMSRSNDTRIAMLRYGEYSPNNPELRVHSQPYLGIGEYEQQQNLLRERRRGENLTNGIPKSKTKKSEALRHIHRNILPEKYSPKLSKCIQTEIQNIHCPLIQYDRLNPNEAQKELSPQRVLSQSLEKSNPNNRELPSYRRANDQNLTSFGNDSVKTAEMEKPKGILTNRKSGSPRDRFMSNLKHTYTPSFMDGFSYSDRTEELDRERKKREAYNFELRMQIEEKRRLQAIKDEQERREQELENRRLEQQLLRMQEEALVDDAKSSRTEQARRHSDDYLRRRADLGVRSGFRRHTDSENSALGTRNALSHYSPPVSRRTPFTLTQSSGYSDPINSRYNPNSPRYDFDSRYRRDTLNRLDSLNVYNSLYDSYDTSRYKKNAFARFDSLSRIDSLGARSDVLDRFDSLNLQDDLGQRRHSATHQDLSLMRRSPKLQRRSNSSRFDDQLPIPVLKARSPVARELKNSIPFNSGRNSSEACRKLEDKWQIPAVQKTIVNHSDSLRDGSNRSVLTQLGAIRMQLQQEQLRMDESLRKRGITQSKAVDFH